MARQFGQMGREQQVVRCTSALALPGGSEAEHARQRVTVGLAGDMTRFGKSALLRHRPLTERTRGCAQMRSGHCWKNVGAKSGCLSLSHRVAATLPSPFVFLTSTTVAILTEVSPWKLRLPPRTRLYRVAGIALATLSPLTT